jgi:glycosyltransferase involved in cell wall biosynthesis
MRILYISLPPYDKWGGGVPIYTYDLAKILSKLGHEIYYLYNWGSDLRLKPYFRKIAKEDITFLEIRNSPVNYTNYWDITLDVTNTKIERIFMQILKIYKTDIIHIQNIMGFPFRIIEVANSLKIPIVNSLHNYFYLCPKVELFTNGKTCSGPNKFKCTRCISIKREYFIKPKSIFKTIFPKNIVKKAQVIKNSFYKNYFNKITKFSITYKQRSNFSLDYVNKMQTRINYSKFILNKGIDINIAVSSRVKDIFSRQGYYEGNFITEHIGTRVTDFIRPIKSTRKNKQIIFGYAGPIAFHKGIHILIDAMEKIMNKNVRLEIYGPKDSQYAQKLIQKAEKDNRIILHGRYDRNNLTDILNSFDVVVIPPIWEDNAPQIVFESMAAKKVIIGANIGGIPDFIQDNIT